MKELKQAINRRAERQLAAEMRKIQQIVSQLPKELQECLTDASVLKYQDRRKPKIVTSITEDIVNNTGLIL